MNTIGLLLCGFMYGTFFGFVLNEVVTYYAKRKIQIKDVMEITNEGRNVSDEKNIYIKNSAKHLDDIVNKPFVIKDKPIDVFPKLEEEVEVAK